MYNTKGLFINRKKISIALKNIQNLLHPKKKLIFFISSNNSLILDKNTLVVILSERLSHYKGSYTYQSNANY